MCDVAIEQPPHDKQVLADLYGLFQNPFNLAREKISMALA
jgi:hypothetical protein